MAIDEAKLNAFMGSFVNDLGAVMHAATVVVGNQLGLYKKLAEKPAKVEDLARRTETDPRYLREWLSTQAASGYVQYDPASETFSLSEEQAFALAQEGSPAFIPGAFQIAVAQFKAIPRMAAAMRTGLGLGWHEHDSSLFHGTERFFRPGYAANLVSQWIPALDGMQCQARSRRTGGRRRLRPRCVDDHHGPGLPGVELCRLRLPRAVDRGRTGSADKAGVADRVRFEVATAKDFPGRDYDLVAVFDCLHDMGDPVGAAAHVKQSLKADGAWLIVEPFANDRLEDNLNPVGRIFYAARPSFARPRRARRKSAPAWARRPGRRASAASLPTAASHASGARRKPPST